MMSYQRPEIKRSAGRPGIGQTRLSVSTAGQLHHRRDVYETGKVESSTAFQSTSFILRRRAGGEATN